MSKYVEVRISEYGPGLFAKNDIEPNTTLVKLRLVFKFNIVSSIVNQLKLRLNLKPFLEMKIKSQSTTPLRSLRGLICVLM